MSRSFQLINCLLRLWQMHIGIFSVYYGSGSGQCAGCPLSFETGGTMGYNCCFFLNFVPLHIESPYNFGGKKPSAEGKWACCIRAWFLFYVKHVLQYVNGHAVKGVKISRNLRLKQWIVITKNIIDNQASVNGNFIDCDL